MHALYLPDVHTTLDNIIIEFIEECSGCNLRTRESSERMGIQSINDYKQSQNQGYHPKGRD
jgi:hypothetical protein